MLTFLSKAVHEVRSEADPFFSIIDQQSRFLKKQPMSVFFGNDYRKIGGQTELIFWPDVIWVHPPTLDI